MTTPDDDLFAVSIDDDDDDGMDWIFTYSDIVTLLFAFFVLLFSMSDWDVRKFTDSFTSVRAALGNSSKSAVMVDVASEQGAIMDTVLLQKQLMQEQRQVFAEIRTFLNRKGVEGVISSVFDEGVITLRLPSDVLFASDGVEVNPEAKEMLGTMKDLFSQHVNQMINIKGYTDDLPPSEDSRFEDNWEISALRAVNVLRFLMEDGVEPQRMTATGLADLDPILPNSNSRNRAQNRRVEFVLQRQVGQ